MSKKHFIALAKALRASRFSMERDAFMLLVNDVADVCQSASTTFNRSTFISYILED
jgi:hypothetical protein